MKPPTRAPFYMDHGAKVDLSVLPMQSKLKLFKGGACVWITGLPASGKTSLARAVASRYSNAVVLDGDEFRGSVSTDLGYSMKDREENCRRAAAVALGLTRQGYLVLCAFVSPTEASREVVRQACPGMVLVYMADPVGVCRARDVKGNYERADRGVLKEFTGVTGIFEAPALKVNGDAWYYTGEADLVLAGETIDSGAEKVMKYLDETYWPTWRGTNP